MMKKGEQWVLDDNEKSDRASKAKSLVKVQNAVTDTTEEARR